MIYELDEHRVELRGAEHFVADNATLIGDVVLEDRTSVWFNAVLRGDVERLHVGAGSNVQDGTVVHADPGYPVRIGEHVTVGHMCMLHGCTIGDNSLIGIGAVILNGARIGRNCIVGAKALVSEGKEIPDNSLVIGVPGRVRRELGEEEIAGLEKAAASYVERLRRYRAGLRARPRG